MFGNKQRRVSRRRWKTALGVALILPLSSALSFGAHAAGKKTPGPHVAHSEKVVWLIADAAGVGGNAGSAAPVGTTANGTGTAGATGIGPPSGTTGAGAPSTIGGNNGAGAVTTTPGATNAPGAARNAGPGELTTTPSPQTGNAQNANPGVASRVPQPTDNGGPKTFTLTQTIQAAVQSSSDLQVAARNVEIDRKRADEAAAAARPNLRANASATRYDQATKISIGGSPPVEVQKNHSELLSINLADSLDILGQIRAASDQARLQSLADQFEYDRIRNSRILRSQTIYFNLLRAQHQVQVAQQNLTAAQRQLTDAQNLFAGQVGQKIDVYRAATQVATAQQQLLAAQNNEAVARVSFNDLVGRPLSAQSDVTDVAGANVGVDVTGTASVDAGTPSAFTPFAVPPGDISGINIDQSLATALAHRPEVLASEVNVRVAQKGIKLARAGLEPTLSLSAAGNYFPTTSFQTPRQRTAEVTATVSVPLYDGGATRDRIAEARLRTENAQTVSESTRSDVSLDVRQTYLGLVTSAGQIDAANTALQQAVAARRLAEIRYQGQVGTYLEVTDAQAALVQAENSQVNAVYDYLIARAQFQNALGTPAAE